MNNSWALLFAIGFAGCSSTAIPTPSTDWQTDVTGDCIQAGASLKILKCPEAEPKFGWLEFCERAQKSNGAIDLRVSCIANAASVEAVRKCRVKCQ